MKNKAILKRSLMYLLALVFLFGTVQANESVSSFEQSVPFGVAHTEDGSNIPVFKKPSLSRILTLRRKYPSAININNGIVALRANIKFDIQVMLLLLQFFAGYFQCPRDDLVHIIVFVFA